MAEDTTTTVEAEVVEVITITAEVVEGAITTTASAMIGEFETFDLLHNLP